MARYIDADKVMEEINRIGGHNLCEWETIGVKALIDRQPTADVVPKSEYDNLKMRFDALDRECDRLEKAESEKHDKIIEAKAKVAREIFAYIEQEIVAALESNYKVISKFVESDDLYYTVKGKISALRGIEGFVEELKKKYLPQECPTCAHFAGCEPSTLGVCEEYKENRDE